MEKKANTLYFNTRDELLKINLDKVVCFEAEANYTRIVLVNGMTSMVRMNLGKMEEFLSSRTKLDYFARIGKRFIVNMSYVCCVNVLKQELVLSDQCSFQRTLSISKEALKQLKDLIRQSISIK